ncbi:unnamed protein product [Cuscuta epithymum]|uniref:Late embryogenesis abundant protein LEA-2 subgroup domain-containing protein n=1 Tax=Cuscuta epithymum TaxID=186058 RepID=A0AAV0DB90_9ASTE|nr:unnamed protein product [Cuscuta epithymum]
MDNLQQKPPSASHHPQQPPRRNALKNFIGMLFAFVVVGGIILLVIWLAIRPHRPVYSVVKATVHSYNLTDSDNRLTADFSFTIKAYNRNRRTSIKYKPLQARLYFGNEEIAVATTAPFRQPPRDVTYLPLSLQAKNVGLDGVKDFKNQRTAGKVELVVKLNGRVRFKTGAWKWYHRRIKVTCKPTVMSYSSDNFKEARCHVGF